MSQRSVLLLITKIYFHFEKNLLADIYILNITENRFNSFIKTKSYSVTKYDF